MDYLPYFEKVHYSQPIWLYAFIVITILIVIFSKLSISMLFESLNFKYVYKHTHLKLISNILGVDKDSSKRNYPLPGKIYYLVIVGLFSVCLSEPFYKGEKLPDPPSNRDILFLVDNEINMVLKDYFIDKKRVERLTMVKSVLLNFANKLSGNRIGIVTFSEEAHTLLPFTTDTKLIKSMIPRIEATLTGRTSNPQKALLYTLNYLHNISGNNSNSSPSIILITDVLRPPRDIDPTVVAKYIKQKGIKLYVIAIGASSYKAEDVKNSTLIYHPASFERLKNIADSAGGDFYWAKNTNSLTDVIKEILISKKIRLNLTPEYAEIALFQWPLAMALLLILFQYLLSLLHLRSSNV